MVSEDLEFFLHDHPRWTGSAFELDAVLPKAGLYRVLADFLPEAATPQLLTRSVFVGGGSTTQPVLARDYARKQGENLAVEMSTTPQDPIAGTTTTLRFVLSPEDGIEPYLGVLGHMLIASDDLIDLMHTHPVTMQVGPVAEFAVVFPRPRIYRVWVQFQRDGCREHRALRRACPISPAEARSGSPPNGTQPPVRLKRRSKAAVASLYGMRSSGTPIAMSSGV